MPRTNFNSAESLSEFRNLEHLLLDAGFDSRNSCGGPDSKCDLRDITDNIFE